jgi:hypothetical protein
MWKVQIERSWSEDIIYTELGIRSDLAMVYRIQEDVYRLYANTSIHITNFSIQGFCYLWGSNTPSILGIIV